jgi:hypothetical protein
MQTHSAVNSSGRRNDLLQVPAASRSPREGAGLSVSETCNDDGLLA